MLRNWITYMLRKCISKEEQKAFYKRTTLENARKALNATLEFEIHLKTKQYKHDYNLETWEQILTYKEIICKKREDGTYHVKTIL